MMNRRISCKLCEEYEITFFNRHALSYRFIESYDEVVQRLPTLLKNKRTRISLFASYCLKQILFYLFYNILKGFLGS